MAINRLFRNLAENLDQTRKQKIADMGGLEDKMNSSFIPGSFTFPGGFNFLGGGFPNRGGFGKFMTGDLPGPVLGPDDFGSYVIPASDPTYSSGFDYARSIAGGIPMSQVIAPGVSYSPEQPMGYTQAQLNTAVGTTPVETPPPPPEKLPAPDDPSFLGTGIGGVTIFDDVFDKKRMPPPRDITGGTRDIRDIPLRDITGGTRDIRDIPPIDGLQNLGRMFGINREMQDIRDMIDRESLEDMLREQNVQELPPITPPFEQPMFPPFIEPNLQITNLPMTPNVNIPPIMELPQMRGADRPNINRFSIEQLPMGLF